MNQPPLDPGAKRMLEILAEMGAPDFADLTPALARRAFGNGVARLGGPAETVATVEDFHVPCRSGARKLRAYRPLDGPGNRRGPGLLWLHGGGFVFGDVQSYDALCRALANRTGSTVFSLEYRLAPEYPFPAASEDVRDTWHWLHGNADALNVAAGLLSIGGDSAGGTLAIGTALSLAPDLRPRAMALAYPGTSSDFGTVSHHLFAEGFLLTRRTIEWCYRHYRGLGTSATDPLLAPLHASGLDRLPPTVMLLAGYDPLHDEGLAMAGRMTEAGVPLTLLEYPTMLHGFLSYPGTIPLAYDATAAFGAALVQLTGGESIAVVARDGIR
jgi:acetyl esterase